MEYTKTVFILLLITLVSIRIYYLSREQYLFSDWEVTRTIIVSQGDTVWGIANKECEGMNIHKAVYLIRELNKIDNPGAIRPGQELRIPVFEKQLAKR